MSKLKIFNDPIYGLIKYPYEFIYDLIDHPYIQRLRRIQQLGMSSIVYPGATHTRFHHALGALHLGDRLINNLKMKGVEITQEEHEATLVAILLHDAGHGPYSHALEHEIIPIHHEALTLQIMHRLNHQYAGRLDKAIAIFTKEYPKTYLTQIISGQIDVDRMDYLNRDSFYTGVAEGIIGYDRIIKMMNVCDNQLVVEEKGIHSVEKFLLARYFMYHQVYQHNAALSADHMLKVFFKEFKKWNFTHISEKDNNVISRLVNFRPDIETEDQLSLFLKIDDSDIIMLIKSFLNSDVDTLRILSDGIINRKLFGITSKDKPFTEEEIDDLIKEGSRNSQLSQQVFRKLVNLGKEVSALYDQKDEIKILRKNENSFVTFGKVSRLKMDLGTHRIHFITYPKAII